MIHGLGRVHGIRKKKNEFLSESLEYATELELYEQCAIIRDVQKTIKY